VRRNGAFAGSAGPIYLGPRRIKITSVELFCEMPSMNDDVPAHDAEGRPSFYAVKTAQSLYAQLGFRQAMASSHIVPRQLDEEIPRDNDDCQEFETQDPSQEVPVVIIPESYAYLFRLKTEIAVMARPSDQSTKVIKEKSVAVRDCGALQTITCSLINCKDVMEKVTIIETANSEENMKSNHACTKTYFVRNRTGDLVTITVTALFVKG
jgi:hypothetical protein